MNEKKNEQQNERASRRIRILQTCGDPVSGQCVAGNTYSVGSDASVTKAQADHWVNQGYAIWV